MRVSDRLVVVKNVTRVFKSSGEMTDVHALGPIDLTLDNGEFFTVVGPSGCGKSTLLEIISGLAEATDGEVWFDGARVRGAVPPGVGIVFQEDASFPWLTVQENIAFGLKRKGVEAREISRLVDNALGLTGLRSFATAYPAQLSGGMRQRVCIARILVLAPRLILLDEPFGALDQQTRLIMGDELLKLWRETGATILLITHALDEATMLSDRVGVMSARPGHFLDVVTTGWKRDRDSRVVSDPEFGRITSHLWSLLRGESIKAISDKT
jgi:NitT/TauT family transport system ATP-binding protein